LQVFEPEEIKHKLLTEDDDLIRSYDLPERMQLAVSTLSGYTQLALPDPLTQAECVDAAAWVAPRLASKERDFFMPDGRFHHLLRDLVEAVTRTLEYLLVQHLEVPYIYAHRRDYISYFNPKDPRNRVELLNQDDLWRIYGLGQKYRSLIERQKALQSTYDRLGVKDEYYEETLKSRLDSVETVADVSQWLAVRYKSNKKDNIELRFHDDEEQPEAKRQKLPTRMTAYEHAKKSLAGALADVSLIHITCVIYF
jgi:transcription elongation factor SPT6